MSACQVIPCLVWCYAFRCFWWLLSCGWRAPTNFCWGVSWLTWIHKTAIFVYPWSVRSLTLAFASGTATHYFRKTNNVKKRSICPWPIAYPLGPWIILYWIILCYVMLYYIMLYHIILSYIILYPIILCMHYVILFFTISYHLA